MTNAPKKHSAKQRRSLARRGAKKPRAVLAARGELEPVGETGMFDVYDASPKSAVTAITSRTRKGPPKRLSRAANRLDPARGQPARRDEGLGHVPFLCSDAG
jgi:hypothetical protein